MNLNSIGIGLRKFLWADEMQKALADNAKAQSTKDTVEVARALYDALLKYREDAPKSEEQSEENQDEQEQQEDSEQEGSEGNESKEGEGSEGAGEKKEQEGGEESGEGDDSQESNEVGEDTSRGFVRRL